MQQNFLKVEEGLSGLQKCLHEKEIRNLLVQRLKFKDIPTNDDDEQQAYDESLWEEMEDVEYTSEQITEEKFWENPGEIYHQCLQGHSFGEVNIKVGENIYGINLENESMIGENAITKSVCFKATLKSENNPPKKKKIETFKLKLAPKSKYQRDVIMFNLNDMFIMHLFDTCPAISLSRFHASCYEYYEYSLIHLKNQLKPEKFTLDSLIAQKLSKDILYGVAHLHKTGLVHRALKQENIFIQPDEHEKEWFQRGKFTCKIGDFDLTKKDQEYWKPQFGDQESLYQDVSDDDPTFGDSDVIEKFISMSPNPKFSDWVMYDVRCVIYIILEIFEQIGLYPGSKSDAGFVLQDLKEKITGIEISLADIERHLCLQSRDAAYNEFRDFFKLVGYTKRVERKWRDELSEEIKTQIEEIGTQLIDANWMNKLPDIPAYWKSAFKAPKNKDALPFRGTGFYHFSVLVHLICENYKEIRVNSEYLAENETMVLNLFMEKIPKLRLKVRKMIDLLAPLEKSVDQH